jgi:glutathione S-transferase
MRIYHRQGAGRPLRIVWTLEELGAPYELVIMTREQGASDEHRSRHPLGRVPVLEDDEGRVFESSALCLYVADLHPDAGLIPPVGTHDRALVYQWAFFAMTEIEAPAIESGRRRENWPELADAAAERTRNAVAVIEQALNGREYLVADRFTVADVIVTGVLRIAVRAGAYEPSRRIAEYLSAMEGRSAMRRAMAKLAQPVGMSGS